MFNSQILRSTATLSTQVAKQSAPRSVKLAVNANQINSLGRSFQHRLASVFEWGAFFGVVMLWPLGAEKFIKVTGGMNNM